MSSPDMVESSDNVLGHPPLEFPPAIDPVFWGTSDLLVWDTGNLLKTIDKAHLFRKIWALDTIPDGEFNRRAAELFEPMFAEFSRLIVENDLMVPRGLYGFFPVIADNTTIILINPTDFHSELLTIPCPQVRMLGGRSLADFYRPEGDVLAVSALTLGPLIDKHIKRLESDAATFKKAGFLRGLAAWLVEGLVRKMAIEVRRGLGIDVATGYPLPFRCDAVDAACETALFEVLGVEERLGIGTADSNQYIPAFSAIQVMTHHPQVKDFIHFGT